MQFLRTVLGALLAAGLAGCGANSAPTVPIDVIGGADDPFEHGVRLSFAGQLVRAATAEGLVGLDEQGRVIPALADRWIVTDDGLSYIFRLRDGSWPDGTEITGETARQSLRAAIAAVAGTGLALDLAPVEEIRAMAARVIEIRLHRPAPDFLQLLAQPELGLLHKEAGGGPMMLRRDGALAVLEAIPPARLGLPQGDDWRASVRSIELLALPAGEATERFARGKVDVVLGGRFESLPLAQGVAGLSRRALKFDPAPGLFGLVVASTRGWLALPECREALAMAVDRDALGNALGIGNWTGTTLIAPPAPGAAVPAERWAERSLVQRRSEAAARIGRCNLRSGDAGRLRLALPAGPGSDALHARLVEDFAAVGVTIDRAPVREAADLRLLDAVARYPRREWYLHQLACAQLRGPCSPGADAKLIAAASATDDVQAAQLIAEAVALQTTANVYLPLGQPVRWSLVRDRVTGFSPNPAAFHPLAPLAQRP